MYTSENCGNYDNYDERNICGWDVRLGVRLGHSDVLTRVKQQTDVGS